MLNIEERIQNIWEIAMAALVAKQLKEKELRLEADQVYNFQPVWFVILKFKKITRTVIDMAAKLNAKSQQEDGERVKVVKLELFC